MPSRKIALGIIGAAIVAGTLITMFLLDGAVTATLFQRVTLPNRGTVKAIGVGVYSDPGCTEQVTDIGWGIVEAGATKNVTVFIRNEGGAPMTLSLETENWNPPEAAGYMSLSWDYGDEVIDVGEAVPVTLSLSVSDSIEGITNFSFDIVIIGSG